MNEILTQFRPHAEMIKEAGGNLYIVGGAVREFLMCRTPHDVDFCVTGIEVDKFRKMFPQARQQGKAFPVFVVDGCEFAMARTERKNGTGYSGFDVFADPTVTIEEDLLRRDLTINSMAIDVLYGTLIDPYGGANALVTGVLRNTSNAFTEDPVRVLRVARIAAETDYTVSLPLITLMQGMKNELRTIDDCRKFKEYRRALMGKYPDKFFIVLRAAGVLDVVFPEFDALYGVQHRNHTDGDVAQHTLRVIRKCRELTENPMTINAAVCHDFGKATTPEDILPAHHDHENRSAEIIRSLTWMPNSWIKYAALVAEEHMRGKMFSEMKRGKKIDLLSKFCTSVCSLSEFCTVLYADRPAEDTLRNIANIHASYARAFSVSGNDLPSTTPSGEAFGAALHQLRCDQLDI